MAGLQQEHQRMLATQVADGDFATAVMMLKEASAYTDRPNVPKKDKRHGGGGGKGQVNVAAGEGSSAKKSQEEVNALLAKKDAETKKKLANQKRKFQGKLKKASGNTGKGPCYACGGPHMLNSCPKWKKVMNDSSEGGAGAASGSGNA